MSAAAPLKHVVVAGATGLVGRELIRQLDSRPEVAVTALVRGTGRLRNLSSRVTEIPFDFEKAEDLARLGADIPCDILLCALGTTIKDAGSQEAFRRVDRDYPMALMVRLAELEQRPLFAVVSSVGAAHPRGYYLQTKAEMEKALFESGLPYLIFRPSLLMGARRVFRLGEWLAVRLLARPYLAFARAFMPQSRLAWKYAPIEAEDVAKAMVRCCLDEPPSRHNRVLTGLALHHPIMDL